MRTLFNRSIGDSFLRNALRDLVIVVVGILGALWLESWWQDRQDRAEETLLLAGLREEFAANHQHLDEIVSIWRDILSSTQKAFGYMGMSLDALDTEDVTQAFLTRRSTRFFDPRAGQLTSLISSGKLSLISNTELRARLADWPSLVEDLDVERQGTLYDLMQSGGPRLRNYLPGGPEGSPFENQLQSMLLDRVIYNDLIVSAGNTRRAIAEGEGILLATDLILKLIDAELAD